MAMDGVAGATVIEVSVAAVTVRTAVLLVMPPEAAVMLEVPVARPVARPALVMVAVVNTEEFQVAELVRSAVVESVKWPVAVNCWVSPLAMDGVAGATVIVVSVAAVTVRTAVLLVMPPEAAVMLDEPAPTPVARPALVMVATAVAEEFQVAELLRSCVEPSVK